jgi:DUF4097 and DUF4098 domain-containing protein YvlB
MPCHLLRPAVFTLLALAGVPALATADTEQVSQTVRLDPGGTLRLNSFSGKVRITGSDRADVSIEAVRHGTRDQLERIRLEVRSQGSTVQIDANRRERWWFDWGRTNVVETDFEIRVPRRTSLDLTLFSASLEVRGVDGSHRVQTFSSATKLDDVNGSIRAKSFSGAIEIRATAWADNPVIDVETFSGAVALRIPETATGRVQFDSFNGNLHSALPLTVDASRRRRISGQFGTGGAAEGGRISVKTFSGGVSLER